MRTTYFSLLFMLFCLVTIQAQESKFDFGINLYPSYSFGMMSNDGSTPGSVQNGFSNIERGKPSISGNLFVEYKLNTKSAIGFGLGYQNNGQRTKKMDLIFNVDPVLGIQENDPDQPTEGQFIYNHHNLEIPVYYKYKFKNQFYILLGVSGIINISNTTTSKLFYADGTKEREVNEDNSTDFRTFNVFGNLGFGMDYLNTDKITLFVHPYVQMGVLGVSKNASLNRNILSLGISTGIRI
ncbi:MAG: outer membrane beta-barrel protein [Brumimicrobium sp.]